MPKLTSLLLITLLVHTAETIWVNEDFWTTVSPMNKLSAGRTVDDFARIGNDNIFPALWITRTRYPEHFESFGFAYVKKDGRVCGCFAGRHAEAVEVCGGFRVLSVPEYYKGQKVFEWVPATRGGEDTVGFTSHRIARRVDANGNVTYGDALPVGHSFFGVQATLDGGAELVHERDAGFLERVSLLRLLVDPRAPSEDRFRNFRRTETASVLPPRENVNVRGSMRMYIPVDVARNEKGELFETKIIDGRIFYFPFDVAETRALTLQQLMQQLHHHGAHKVHGKRRRRSGAHKEVPTA